MPYLGLVTNKEVPPAKAEAFLRDLSAAAAAAYGKPERAFQLSFDGGRPMLHAGTAEPTVFAEFRGINFPEGKAAAVAETVCRIIEQHFGIPAARVSVAFQSHAGSMWAVNGKPFETPGGA